MIEEIEVTKEQRQIYSRLLQNLASWAELMKNTGPHKSVLELDGEEFCYFNMLDGLDTLTPIQRRALFLIYIRDMRTDEAAEDMGIPGASVRQHADRGVEKLCIYKFCADNGLPLPKVKSVPVTRKVL